MHMQSCLSTERRHTAVMNHAPHVGHPRGYQTSAASPQLVPSHTISHLRHLTLRVHPTLRFVLGKKHLAWLSRQALPPHIRHH